MTLNVKAKKQGDLKHLHSIYIYIYIYIYNRAKYLKIYHHSLFHPRGIPWMKQAVVVSFEVFCTIIRFALAICH